MKSKIVLFLSILITFISCAKDEFDFDFESLDPSSEQFFKIISCYDDWYKDWTEICDLGTPLTAERYFIYNIDTISYVFIPIVNNNKITHLAFYSMYLEKDVLKVNSPKVFSKSNNNEILVQSVIRSEVKDLWEESGYDMDFQKIDDLNTQHNLSRYYLPNTHSFGFTVFYNYVGTTEEYIKFLEYLEFSFMPYYTVLWTGKDKRLEFYAQGHSCLQFNAFDFDELTARTNYMFFQQELTRDILWYRDGKVAGVWFNHLFEYIYDEGPKDVDYGFIGGGNNDNDKDYGHKEYDDQPCDRCGEYDCICPTKLILYTSVERAEVGIPYSIIMRVESTKDLNPVSYILQMSRVNSNDWTTIASGYDIGLDMFVQHTRISCSPGHWMIRYQVQFAELRDDIFSPEIYIEEQYPHRSRFMDSFKRTLDELWEWSIDFAATNPGFVKEYGMNIYYDHYKGFITQKEFNGSHFVGPAMPCEAGSSGLVYMEYTLDNNRLPTYKGELVVGQLHTHTCLTYAIKDLIREGVGPSSEDENSPIPGLLKDYESPIRTGHAVDAPTRYYPYGPDRRETPN